MILALDPSFTATGWAILRKGEIVGCGCIRTEPSAKKRGVRVADDDAERTGVIARELKRLIHLYQIQGIVAELPSGGSKGARANACMAKAGAIVASVAACEGIPSEWVTPGDVKRITGQKKASKDEVEEAVLRRWPAAELPRLACEREHAADALGAYLAAKDGNLVRLIERTATVQA